MGQLPGLMMYALTAGLAPTQAPQQDAELASTIVKGVLAREASIRDVRGFVTHTIHRSDRDREIHQKLIDDFAERYSTRPYTVSDFSQYLARFLIADKRARWEAVALQRNGINSWRVEPSIGPRVRLRGVEEGQGGPGDRCRSVVVKDGEREFWYQDPLGMGSVRPQEGTVSVIHHVPLCSLLMFGSLKWSFGERLWELYEKTTGGAEEAVGRRLTHAGQEPVGDILCHKLVFEADKPKWWSRHEAWIAADPDWKCAVIQKREINRSKGENTSGSGQFYTSRDWREVGDGIWLPHEVTLQYFQYRKGAESPLVRTGAGHPWMTTETATFHDLQANQGVTDADFHYEFPLGTFIDNREGLYEHDIPPDVWDLANKEGGGAER